LRFGWLIGRFCFARANSNRVKVSACADSWFAEFMTAEESVGLIRKISSFAHISRAARRISHAKRISLRQRRNISPACIGCPCITFFHIPRIPPHRLTARKTNHALPILYGQRVSQRMKLSYPTAAESRGCNPLVGWGLGKGETLHQKPFPLSRHFVSDMFASQTRYAPAARDMCARRLPYLVKPTGSSAVINFANEEYAHTKYLLLLLPSALRLPPTHLGQASAGFAKNSPPDCFLNASPPQEGGFK